MGPQEDYGKEISQLVNLGYKEFCFIFFCVLDYPLEHIFVLQKGM